MSEVINNDIEDLASCFATDGTTAKTRAHIKKALRDYLKKEYNCSKANDFLKIQGLDDAHFDYVGSVSHLMYADLATESIDPNANKGVDSITRVQSECDNAPHKLLGHDFLYRQLKMNVGKEEATRLTAEMMCYDLGINDATKILVPYCFCISGMGLVLEGRDGSPKCAPPKHLHSYVSMLAGTIHEMSNSALCGAIAIGTFFFDCARVLLTDGYTLEDIKENPHSRKYIENMFQQFIYDVNDKTRHTIESPFTNVSIFSKYKARSLIQDMDWYYEDTGKDLEYVLDVIEELQEIYMDIMDKGDPLFGGMQFTFPVTTVCMTKNDDGEIMDQDFVKRFCKRPVNRYNIFVSKGTKAASCCFDGNQKVVIKTKRDIRFDTFENLASSKYEWSDTNTRVLHNGNWARCRRVSVPYSDEYYKITTSNNKSIIVTKDHLNPTCRGDVKAEELTCDDWIMFNTRALSPCLYGDLDHKLTYADGFAVGLFLGDGSYIRNGDVFYGVNYSLNSGCFYNCKKYIDEFLSNFSTTESYLGSIQHNTYPLIFRNNDAVNFIKGFVNGDRSYNKSLNLSCLNESLEFRRGLLAGWYESDGGNSNRCYSVSKDLIDTMEVLCTSIGYNTIIDVCDRSGEDEVIIRGEEFNRNYPLYCLRWYAPVGKRRQGNIYKIFNNSIYFKITNIEKVYGSSKAYCVEIIGDSIDEPYFTLPNGIITHNCRLLSDSEMMDTASSVNSFGGGGALSIGSHRVVCINMPRVALKATSMDNFMERLDGMVKDATTILRAHKDLLLRLEKIGKEPYMTNGMIKMDRLFSTVGTLGIYEMFKTLEEKFGADEDRDVKVMKAFNDICMKYGKQFGLIVNIEQIPGESMSVRFCNADKLIFGEKAIPYYIYSNQTVPLTEKVDIYDRMDKDGRINLLLTGGGIVHLTVGERVTPEQAERLIKYAVKSGCEHFALNLWYSKCVDGHVTEGKHEECTVCKKKIDDYATRIVGFVRWLKTWSATKRKEGLERHQNDLSKIL